MGNQGVNARGKGVGMLGMLRMWRIRMGMQGIRVGMREIRVIFCENLRVYCFG